VAFQSPTQNPLSTFSIDVDTASYANCRRYLNDNMLPPPPAVRVEEFINYFNYQYPNPRGEHPIAITTELAPCPWNGDNELLLVGLQGKTLDTRERMPNNLVFLLDVSGSMNSADKLPLLQSAMRLLTKELRPEDSVSIVTYAGSARHVLKATHGSDKPRILHAINNLRAAGSTAGGAGIQMAYDEAQTHFIHGGNNRVILATDGDFNVGVSTQQGLMDLIRNRRDEGVYLSVLGFGTGNLKDNKMETLAQHGNGNYAYIDGILEAKKALVTEFGGTMVTIAKDVKIQIEFNPATVKSYRLIGYDGHRAVRDRARRQPLHARTQIPAAKQRGPGRRA
jgi:Ca-activated chloride channel family protein